MKRSELEAALDSRGANQDGVLSRAFKKPPSYDLASRSALFIMTTEEPDRNWGDILRIKGLGIDDFETNPIALLNHVKFDFPIGQWSDLRKVLSGKPKRIEGRLNFADEGDYERADIAARLTEKGILRAVSVGFMITDAEWIFDDEGNNTYAMDILASELLETSLVSVPADKHSLVKAADGDLSVAMELIEDVLDNWQRNSAGLIVPRERVEGIRGEIASEMRKPKKRRQSAAPDERTDDMNFDDLRQECGEIVREAVAEAEKSLKREIDTSDIDQHVEKAVSGFRASITGIVRALIGAGKRQEEAPEEPEDELPSLVFDRLENGAMVLLDGTEPHERAHVIEYRMPLLVPDAEVGDEFSIRAGDRIARYRLISVDDDGDWTVERVAIDDDEPDGGKVVAGSAAEVEAMLKDIAA